LVAGRHGKALQFDGRNDMVSIADAASLDIANGMTLEAWVKPTALGSAWRTVIVKERARQLSYGLYASSPKGKASGHVFKGNERAVAGKKRRKGRWAHLATTWDGHTMRVWLNGREVARKALMGSASRSKGGLRIGGNTVWSEWFKGKIDDVRVYRRALAA